MFAACLTLVSCVGAVGGAGLADGGAADSGKVDSGTDGTDSGTESPDSGSPDPTLSDNEKQLVNMPANSWLKVSTGYASKCDDTFTLPWHAVGGCGALIAAWSSGVWDPTRRQMLLFGGGHADYAGNEIYAFSTKTFTWTQLTQPSPPPYDRDPLTDERPVSRHTYDGVTWVTDRDRMLAWGGAMSMSGHSTNVTWLFDPAAASTDAPSWSHPMMSNTPNGAYDLSTVYDPVTKTVVVKVIQGFYRIDLAAQSWTLLHDLGYPPLWPRYAGGSPRGVMDAKRRLMWFVGGGLYMIYAVDTDTFVTDEWVTTGGGAFDNAAAVVAHPQQRIVTGGGDLISKAGPGLDYDSKADQMVGWVGGGPYVLDLATKVWTRKDSGTDVPATPGNSGGTLGRLRYLAEYNVFILVTSPNEVFFFKNTAGGK